MKLDGIYHETEIPPEAIQYFEVCNPPTKPAVVLDPFSGRGQVLSLPSGLAGTGLASS